MTLTPRTHRDFDPVRARREVMRALGTDKPQDLDREMPHIVSAIVGMGQYGAGRDDPVRSLTALLGDQWSTLILLVLQDGPFRYAVLHRLVSAVSDQQAISQRMLSLRLRALEREGLVARAASLGFPPRVEYAITEFGTLFLAQVRNFAQWIINHIPRIDEARLSLQLRLAEDPDHGLDLTNTSRDGGQEAAADPTDGS